MRLTIALLRCNKKLVVLRGSLADIEEWRKKFVNLSEGNTAVTLTDIDHEFYGGAELEWAAWEKFRRAVQEDGEDTEFVDRQETKWRKCISGVYITSLDWKLYIFTDEIPVPALGTSAPERSDGPVTEQPRIILP